MPVRQLVVGWSVGSRPARHVVGIPISSPAVTLAMGRGLERRFANAALGAGIPRPRRTTGRGIRGLVTDPATWRDQAFLAVRATAGFGFGVAAVAAVSAPLNLISYPFWYWAVDDDNRMAFGVWSVNSLPEASRRGRRWCFPHRRVAPHRAGGPHVGRHRPRHPVPRRP